MGMSHSESWDNFLTVVIIRKHGCDPIRGETLIFLGEADTLITVPQFPMFPMLILCILEHVLLILQG